MQTDVAQPAIGAACVGMLRLLRSLGLEPDMVAGHSYGELVALHAAGVLATEELSELSLARGRLMQEAGRGATGAMAALLAGPEAVEDLIRDMPDVEAANWNGPKQTVIAGPSEAIRRAIELAIVRGIAARALPVSCAFHTRMIAGRASRWRGSRATASARRRTGRCTPTWTPPPTPPIRRPSQAAWAITSPAPSGSAK